MMEQLPENNTGQDDSSVVAPENSVAAPAMSLGKMLREARELAGLSVADVAHQIKFAPRQIEALEADDFQNLPEMTFVRGFVRSYAKILNQDAQPLLAALPQADATPMPLIPVSVEVPFPVASSPQRQNLVLLGAALLLAVLVVAFAVWHYTTPISQPEVAQIETPVPLPSAMQIIPASPVLESGAIAPLAAPTARPALVAAQALATAAKPSTSQSRDAPLVVGGKPEVLSQAQPTKMTAQSGIVPQTQPAKTTPQPNPQTAVLRLTFDEDSWVEIKGKDDKILSSQVNLRGSELRLNGQTPFSLVIGRAASVRLYHKGKQVDLTPHTSSSGEVARLTLE